MTAYTISRADFEAQIGPLNVLQAAQYLADPRKLLADFYQRGDSIGPGGTLLDRPAGAPGDGSSGGSAWFAVYRPCSRDSIAKMVGRVGVGKGLNVKGKSAKKNRLSGFVPFVQISDNAHKSEVEESPAGARTQIFYRTAKARAAALAQLSTVLKDTQFHLISKYEPDVFGLDVPEELMREAYIMRPDLSPLIG